ncbi:MAG: hypothetical protein WA996_02155 [Candidatus Promineifilaceae bacterium]
MTRKSMIPIRKIFILLLLLALPALACNPLSGAKEEVAENASSLVEGIVEAVEEQSDAAQEDESVALDSTLDNSTVDGATDAGQGDDPASSESGSGDSSSSADGESPEAITGALHSSLTVDSMRMRITSEDLSSGLTTEVTMAFVRPDRYQMSSEGVEIIVIGDTTYLGTPDGEWVETPANMSSTVEEALLAFVSDEAVEERLDSFSSDWSRVNSLGTEKINGVEVRGYEYEENSTDQFSSLVRMWIGIDDGLLYRQEIEGNIAGLQSRTMMDFEYGDDVVIEPPY